MVVRLLCSFVLSLCPCLDRRGCESLTPLFWGSGAEKFGDPWNTAELWPNHASCVPRPRIAVDCGRARGSIHTMIGGVNRVAAWAAKVRAPLQTWADDDIYITWTLAATQKA